MTAARAAFAVVATALLGCATADLKGPSPSQNGGTACGDAPQIACDAGAPGAGCVGAPRSGDAGGAVYPVGCRAYFTAPDCSTESTCSCVPDDAGAPRWTCDP
jgi:hypothetical protein